MIPVICRCRPPNWKQTTFADRTIQTLADLALVELRLGFSDNALEALQRALILGWPGGFIRSIVDAGSALIPLLQQLREGGIAPGYVSKLLDALAPRGVRLAAHRIAGGQILNLLTQRRKRDSAPDGARTDQPGDCR